MVQGEERIVPVDAWGRAHVVYGQTRRRSLLRTTKIIFYPTILSAFSVVPELGAQKGPKMGSWQLHRGRPSKAARPPIEHDERSFSMWRSANPSKGAKGSITRSLVPPSVSRAVQ